MSATWSTSNTIDITLSNSGVTWYIETDIDGNTSFFYVNTIPIIGFRPTKGRTFISDSNISEMFVLGVRHETYS